MSKRKIKEKFEIFNLSFLDIISCGFGAVVLLVLISNSSENTSAENITEVETLLAQVITLEDNVKNLAKDIDNQQNQNDEQLAESGSLGRASETLIQKLGQKEKEENALTGDLAGLSLVEETLNRVSITPTSTNTTRDEEVGGIPVDSDYVVFVVDTSGSMLAIWNRVASEILNTLSIHPKVKGFQILNDQGRSLISGYKGRWIPDTPQRRKAVMKVFGAWNDASNSSPVEGIETALRNYSKPNQTMSIYVFGDDYTGGSYDSTISRITKMNRGGGNKRLAKIHAVGFLSQHTTNRFAILMRELTKRNGGTFIALPFKK
jgi:hypothetical protein